MSMLIRHLLLCLLFLPLTLAVLVNVTIDDTFGDNSTGAMIQYAPQSSWNIGGNCPTCTADPDPSQALDSTWHEGTFLPIKGASQPIEVLTATVPFFGTAVYVFCILPLSNINPTGRSDMTFFVDSVEISTFSRTPQPGGAGFQFNFPAFTVQNLAPTNHTLQIQSGHANGQPSVILLDYIVYTFDDEQPPSSANSSAGMATGASSQSGAPPSSLRSSSSKSRILGGVFGTLFGLLFVGFAYYVYRRYKRYPAVLPMSVGPRKRSWLDKLSRRFSWVSKGHNRASSFNPQLFVQRLSQRRPATMPAPPPSQPAVPLVAPRPHTTHLPYVPHPPPQLRDSLPPGGSHSPLPLLPNGAVPTPLPSANLSLARIESIQAWQQQMRRETVEVPEMRDMSEQLSSYYDDNATESQRIRTPPPPVRHFTIMNR